jgi:hypothetical protein
MDEDRDIERVMEILRAVRNAPPDGGRPADFRVVRALADEVRRRRQMGRVLAVAATVAILAGLAGLVMVLSGAPPGARGREVEAVSPDAPVPGSVPRLVRMEPAQDLVVFAEQAAAIEFRAADHIILSNGTIVLQLRPGDSNRHLVVETPSADVRVIGTVVAITVGPAGTAVEVLRGHVVVTLAGGAQVGVATGMSLAPGGREPTPLADDRSAWLSDLFPDQGLCDSVSDAGTPSEAAQVTTVAATPAPPAPSMSTRPHAEPAGPRPGADVAGEADLSVSSPTLDELYAAAETARREGRLGDAVELLERILAAGAPGSAREETVLFDLADAHRLLGDPGARERALEMYLDRHPAGTLREDAQLELCRLREAAGTVASRRSCLEAYLSEFPAGAMADWARTALARLNVPEDADDGG